MNQRLSRLVYADFANHHQSGHGAALDIQNDDGIGNAVLTLWKLIGRH